MSHSVATVATWRRQRSHRTCCLASLSDCCTVMNRCAGCCINQAPSRGHRVELHRGKCSKSSRDVTKHLGKWILFWATINTKTKNNIRILVFFTQIKPFHNICWDQLHRRPTCSHLFCFFEQLHEESLRYSTPTDLKPLVSRWCGRCWPVRHQQAG